MSTGGEQYKADGTRDTREVIQPGSGRDAAHFHKPRFGTISACNSVNPAEAELVAETDARAKPYSLTPCPQCFEDGDST